MLTQSRSGVGTVVMVVFIIVAVGLSVHAASYEPDSTGRAFKIGYDQGLSCRYYPNEVWGFGVLFSSPNWNGLYYTRDNERFQVRDRDSVFSSDRSKGKGIGAAIQALRLVKKSDRFTLNVFALVGGMVSTERRFDNYHRSDYDVSGDSVISRTDVDEYGTTTRGVNGRLGIMPGVTWGPLSVEFKFGVEGSYNVETSPETATMQQDGKNSAIKFIYPEMLIGALIVHYEW